MYAPTSIEPVMRTRATLRSAEFGFFGVVVYTRVQTPRRWGAATFFLRPLPDFRPGVASFLGLAVRPLRTSWLVVGMRAGMVAAPSPRARRGDSRSAVGDLDREATAAALDLGEQVLGTQRLLRREHPGAIGELAAREEANRPRGHRGGGHDAPAEAPLAVGRGERGHRHRPAGSVAPAAHLDVLG